MKVYIILKKKYCDECLLFVCFAWEEQPVIILMHD